MKDEDGIRSSLRALSRLDRVVALLSSYGPEGNDTMNEQCLRLLGHVAMVSYLDLCASGCAELGDARMKKIKGVLA